MESLTYLKSIKWYKLLADRLSKQTKLNLDKPIEEFLSSHPKGSARSHTRDELELRDLMKTIREKYRNAKCISIPVKDLYSSDEESKSHQDVRAARKKSVEKGINPLYKESKYNALYNTGSAYDVYLISVRQSLGQELNVVQVLSKIYDEIGSKSDPRGTSGKERKVNDKKERSRPSSEAYENFEKVIEEYKAGNVDQAENVDVLFVPCDGLSAEEVLEEILSDTGEDKDAPSSSTLLPKKKYLPTKSNKAKDKRPSKPVDKAENVETSDKNDDENGKPVILVVKSPPTDRKQLDDPQSSADDIPPPEETPDMGQYKDIQRDESGKDFIVIFNSPKNKRKNQDENDNNNEDERIGQKVAIRDIRKEMERNAKDGQTMKEYTVKDLKNLNQDQNDSSDTPKRKNAVAHNNSSSIHITLKKNEYERSTVEKDPPQRELIMGKDQPSKNDNPLVSLINERLSLEDEENNGLRPTSERDSHLLNRGRGRGGSRPNSIYDKHKRCQSPSKELPNQVTIPSERKDKKDEERKEGEKEPSVNYNNRSEITINLRSPKKSQTASSSDPKADQTLHGKSVPPHNVGNDRGRKPKDEDEKKEILRHNLRSITPEPVDKNEFNDVIGGKRRRDRSKTPVRNRSKTTEIDSKGKPIVVSSYKRNSINIDDLLHEWENYPSNRRKSEADDDAVKVERNIARYLKRFDSQDCTCDDKPTTDFDDLKMENENEKSFWDYDQVYDPKSWRRKVSEDAIVPQNIHDDYAECDSSGERVKVAVDKLMKLFSESVAEEEEERRAMEMIKRKKEENKSINPFLSDPIPLLDKQAPKTNRPKKLFYSGELDQNFPKLTSKIDLHDQPKRTEERVKLKNIEAKKLVSPLKDFHLKPTNIQKHEIEADLENLSLQLKSPTTKKRIADDLENLSIQLKSPKTENRIANDDYCLPGLKPINRKNKNDSPKKDAPNTQKENLSPDLSQDTKKKIHETPDIICQLDKDEKNAVFVVRLDGNATEANFLRYSDDKENVKMTSYTFEKQISKLELESLIDQEHQKDSTKKNVQKDCKKENVLYSSPRVVCKFNENTFDCSGKDTFGLAVAIKPSGITDTCSPLSNDQKDMLDNDLIQKHRKALNLKKQVESNIDTLNKYVQDFRQSVANTIKQEGGGSSGKDAAMKRFWDSETEKMGNILCDPCGRIIEDIIPDGTYFILLGCNKDYHKYLKI